MFTALRLHIRLENGYLLAETCAYSTDKAYNTTVTVYVNIVAQ